MDNQGWIKIYRKMLEWEWYDDHNAKILFIHLLLKANHRDKQWRGNLIKRGQRLTSYSNLAKEVRLTLQQTRTALDKLKSTGEITIKTTNKYTVITIENYIDYQDSNTQDNKRVTNKQQTNNKQITTNKNDKKVKNEKNENKYICSFEEWWLLYPRKVAKKKAEDIYQKKATSKEVESAIFQSLYSYKKKWVAEGTAINYIPHPSTWLNQERWEDDVVTGVNPQEQKRGYEEVKQRKEYSREFEKDMAQKKKQTNAEYDSTKTSGVQRLSTHEAWAEIKAKQLNLAEK